MKHRLNNHKLLEKISGFHEKNSTKSSEYSPWFIDSDTYTRRKSPLRYYAPKVIFVIILTLFLGFAYQLADIVRSADICSPALNKAKWDMNDCEIKTGQTWYEYAWPNRY